MPRSQGLGLRKERFCMNRKRNRKEQIRKVASKVLEIEARLRQGAPVQHQHCPEGYKRGTTEKAKKTKGKVSGKRWTSPAGHNFSYELLSCTENFRREMNYGFFCLVSPMTPSMVSSGLDQREHLKTIF